MNIIIHQPHDKFFKRNLKEKKVAIDILKAHLEPEIYEKIDINSLALTEKSFVVPQLREIHSDIIYKCLINNKPGYLNFLFEHQSTPDPLMAFRFLHSTVSLSYEYLLQGHKKLPIILAFCIYHGEASPYPYTNDLYDTFEDPELARKLAFKPFKLIDLTILSDEEISQHGLAALMEMLFKYQRDKNFLSIMKKMLQDKIVQNVVKKLNVSYLTDMLNYIVNTSQDDNDPQAAQHLIQELIQAFPQEKEVIMTFAQQLKQEALQQGLQQGLQKGLQQGLEQGLQQGFEKGKHAEALIIAKNMLAEGMSPKAIQKLTGLPENEVMDLVKKH